MKILAFVGLIFCSTAVAAPPPWSSKVDLPEQASARAHENRAEKQEQSVTPVLPLPSPLIPPSMLTFTTGETSGSKAAADAVAAATRTTQVRINQAASVSVITMTATMRSTQITRLRPVGRNGDLENSRWSFADRYGRLIGNGNTLCRWANVARRLCWGEVRLPRGRLVVMGSSQTRLLGEYAVIGGTGVYTFKQGLLVFRQLSLKKYAIRVLLA